MGKTTLADSLGADQMLYLNCDLPSTEDIIAVGRYDEVELLNPVTRAVIRKLTGIKSKIVTSRFAHEGGILRLALSLDGKLLASTSTDKSLKLWNTADLTEKLPLEKQPDWSAALAFTDKAQLVAGRIDGSLSVYASGK